MNRDGEERLARWAARQWGWIDHYGSGSDQDRRFKVDRFMQIGMDIRQVSLRQVHQPEFPYVTSMTECEGGCTHDHEFLHWYDPACRHRHLAVHVAMGGGRPVWAVAFEVDDMREVVPVLDWERKWAAKMEGVDTQRGQQFMRLPLHVLQRHGLVLYSAGRLPVSEPEQAELSL